MSLGECKSEGNTCRQLMPRFFFFFYCFIQEKEKITRKNKWGNSSIHVSAKKNYRIFLPGNIPGGTKSISYMLQGKALFLR